MYTDLYHRSLDGIWAFPLRVMSLMVSLMLLVSCASQKDVQYLQDMNSGQVGLYRELEPTMQVGDILAITVNSRSPELAAPFNLPLVSYDAGRLSGQLSQTMQLQGYMVERDGTINFPLVGRLMVVGLTKQEVMDRVSKAIVSGNYLQDPIVTMNMLNFKISVLGEVNKPGTYPVDNERMTILQALAAAGDMTIYGRRDKVVVLREADGQRIPMTIDLRSSSIFKSPVYFLRQNDVIIVSPNETKAQMARINPNNSAGVWISVASAATSVATLMVMILRN